jgi:uncharacterized repeat protein (TIGR01451 family)
MKQILLLIFATTFLLDCYCQNAPSIVAQRSFGGTGNEETSSIKITPAFNGDDNLFIGCTSPSNDGDITGNHGGHDIWIASIIGSNQQVRWKRSLGGSLYEYFRSLYKASDGSVLVAGTTYSNDGDVSNNHGDADGWLVKLDSSGTILWQKCYGGTSYDELNCITPTQDGGFVIVGTTWSVNGDLTGVNFLASSEQVWAFKIDANGNMLWRMCVGGSGADRGVVIRQTADGGYIVGAYTSSLDRDVIGNHGDGDIWLLKLDNFGFVQWKRCYGGTNAELLGDIQVLPDGSFLVGGYTASGAGDESKYHGGGDAWILKLTNTGTPIWQKCYGGSGEEYISTIIPLQDGTFVLSGYTTSSDGDIAFKYNAGGPSRLRDAWLVKITPTGSINWQKTIGGSENDGIASALYVNKNKIILLGGTSSNDYDVLGNHGNHDLWVVAIADYNLIKGVIFYDDNKNGSKDPTEKFTDKVLVTTAKDTYNSVLTRKGQFEIQVDTGTFITKASKTYYTSVPASKSTTFTSYFQTDSFSFALQPIANKKDLVISIIPLSAARPGFKTSYRIYYQNIGTTIIPSGQILLKMDSHLEFVSAFPAISSNSGDTLKWNYTNLNPGDTAAIIVQFQVKTSPQVNNGDTLTTVALITPLIGDETPGDDSSSLKQLVVGSYDPNDKYENQGGVISPQLVKNGNYLHYTIRFQNTGTDTAFNVIIRDTLENRLDWSTLQMITGSHTYNLTIENNNKLTCTFSNIHLPDSNKNEPASHGFITYRIKPKGNVTTGDTIKNSASIYFDYNLPVQTNIHNTIIKNNLLTSIPYTSATNTNFKVFPNPADELIHLAIKQKGKGWAYLSVIDMKGTEVIKKELGFIYLTNGFTTSLNLKAMASGAYTVLLYVGNQIYASKFLVK